MKKSNSRLEFSIEKCKNKCKYLYCDKKFVNQCIRSRDLRTVEESIPKQRIDDRIFPLYKQLPV